MFYEVYDKEGNVGSSVCRSRAAEVLVDNKVGLWDSPQPAEVMCGW